MTDVYVTRAEVQSALGSGTTGDTTRIDWSCIAATRWVLYRCGTEQTDDTMTTPGTLTAVATTPARKLAALAAAVHFYNLPLAQFGVVGVGEWGMTLKSDIPQAEAYLTGQRESFGFA